MQTTKCRSEFLVRWGMIAASSRESDRSQCDRSDSNSLAPSSNSLVTHGSADQLLCGAARAQEEARARTEAAAKAQAEQRKKQEAARASAAEAARKKQVRCVGCCCVVSPCHALRTQSSVASSHLVVFFTTRAAVVTCHG